MLLSTLSALEVIPNFSRSSDASAARSEGGRESLLSLEWNKIAHLLKAFSIVAKALNPNRSLDRYCTTRN